MLRIVPVDSLLSLVYAQIENIIPYTPSTGWEEVLLVPGNGSGMLYLTHFSKDDECYLEDQTEHADAGAFDMQISIEAEDRGSVSFAFNIPVDCKLSLEGSLKDNFVTKILKIVYKFVP